MKNHFVAFFKIVFFIGALAAPEFAFSKYSTQFFTVNNGLSNNSVNTIFQDQSGYLWIGTEDGLNLFDGATFRIFRHEPGKANSLAHNKILFVQQDKKGGLWVGTSKSISLYHPGNNTFSNYFLNTKGPSGNFVLEEKNTAQNQFFQFYLDGSDHLWASIYKHLVRIDMQALKIEFYPQKNTRPQLAGKHINRILELNPHKLLIGSSDAGLELLSLDSKTTRHLNALKGKDISFLVRSGQNTLWVGTYGSGLGTLDWKKDRFEPAALTDSSTQKFRLNNILCGMKSSNGKIFIGSEAGLFSMDKKSKRFTVYTDDGLFPSKPVVRACTKTIFEDRECNLWVGTYRDGLVYIQKKSPVFSVLKDLQPGSNQAMGYINAIAENKNSILLASGERGLIKFDPYGKKFSCFGKGVAPFYLPSNETCYLFRHSSGKLWIGTPNAGVYAYDPALKKGHWFLLAPPDKNYNSGNQTEAIVEDARKNIWVATEGDGIKIIDPESYSIKCLREKTLYPDINGTLSSNWVRSLALDQFGDVWIGTLKGLNKYKVAENKIINFYANDAAKGALKDNTITQLLLDKKNNLWFATTNGLHLLTNPGATENAYIFKNYTSKEGLNNNTIHAIAEDRSGRIWMSTNGGISMLDVGRGSIVNYPFQDLPVNFFCEKSVCALSNGLMLFGGINSLLYFDPNAIEKDTQQLAAHIAELRLFNRPVLSGDTINGRILLRQAIDQVGQIELYYKEDVCSFMLSAINFQDPNGLEYSYKLEGFDQEWSIANASNRLVTYTHLAPGTYSFRIKVKKTNGPETSIEKILKIHILPPWWSTNLAYVLYFLTGIFLLWLYRFITLKQLQLKQGLALQKEKAKKQEELLEAKMEFYTNVSHEFKTPLTLIQGPVEKLIKEDKDPGRQKLYGLLMRNALLLKKYIDEILLFRKVQTQNQELTITRQDFISFVQPLVEAFQFQAQTRNVRLEIQADDMHLDSWFDRDKVEKILMNLLSNALKYSPENEVVKMKIALLNEGASIKISITDAGPGIPVAEHEKIFEEFYQSRTNPNTAGTGIGLSFVKSLVQLHKGTISLVVEKEAGTTFTVLLPIKKEQYEQSEISETEIDNSIPTAINIPLNRVKSQNVENVEKKKYKILLVEDNHAIRSFIKEELEKNYFILEAENGKAGLSAAYEHRPDLVISDVMMPEMDGYQLCKLMKTSEELSAIPLLLLTAKSSEESVLAGLEFGAVDYIAKPFNMEILKAKVKNILQQIAKLQEKWKPSEANEAIAISPDKDPDGFLTKLINGITTHIENTDLSPALLGEIVGISRTKLYGLVAKHTGHSVIDFIYIIRMRKAAELLPTGKYTVNEVAWKLGFKQHSHFTKKFTEHFGKPPSAFIP